MNNFESIYTQLKSNLNKFTSLHNLPLLPGVNLNQWKSNVNQFKSIQSIPTLSTYIEKCIADLIKPPRRSKEIWPWAVTSLAMAFFRRKNQCSLLEGLFNKFHFLPRKMLRFVTTPISAAHLSVLTTPAWRCTGTAGMVLFPYMVPIS